MWRGRENAACLLHGGKLQKLSGGGGWGVPVPSLSQPACLLEGDGARAVGKSAARLPTAWPGSIFILRFPCFMCSGGRDVCCLHVLPWEAVLLLGGRLFLLPAWAAGSQLHETKAEVGGMCMALQRMRSPSPKPEDDR